MSTEDNSKKSLAPKFQRQSSANRSRSSRGLPGTAGSLRSKAPRTAASGISGAGSKAGGTGPKPPLQLLDADGRDVTPRSLLDPNKRVTADDVGRKPSEAFALGDRSVIWGSNHDHYRTTIDGGTAFPTNFNRSTRGSTYSTASAHLSVADDFGDDLPTSSIVAGLGDVQTLRRAAEKEQLQDADLNKIVTITLTETDTLSLFELPSTWAPADTDQAAQVAADNARRDALAARLNESREGLTDHGAQTISNAAKSKDVQVSGPATSETGAQASTHDLADTYSALSLQLYAQRLGTKSATGYARRAIQAFKGMPLTPFVGAGTQTEAYLDPLASDSSEPPLLREMGFGLKRIVTGSMVPETAADLRHVAALPSFQASCRLTERLVAHTLRGVPQQQYRREPSALALLGPTGSEPCVRGLWTYSCSLTEGRAVTAMAWNKHNPDIVAVGYGSLEFGGSGSGLICCWSIKNPEHPERVYHTSTPVSALDFASERPSLLAVGLHDGNVMVFDVGTPSDSALFDTREREITAKHSQPVWDLKWVVRERMIGEEKGEVFVTAGADGRVLQWSLLRGLEHTEIMLAKRVAKDSSASTEVLHKGNAKAAFMARTATLMSVDFLPDDHNIYLLATEDGNIHRCSCSYNEQFLSTYTGHSGAIYRVSSNPTQPDVFLSCGADWSVRLWLRDSEQPRATLQASSAPVLSATWSPHCPSVLASLSGGTLNVWDLVVRPMDPLVSTPVTEDSILTAVLFASNADAILTGDSAGRVYVQLLCNMPDHSKESLDDQRAHLLSELTKNK